MTRDDIMAVQRALNTRGAGLAVDGIDGPRTKEAAYRDALRGEAPKPPAILSLVPPGWMPPAKMDRVIVHWTAGKNTASVLDREHYHILIEGDGKLVRGLPSIDLNQTPVRAGYAAHTRNCNSGSIGVSLCGMMLAREAPFDAGPCPITRVQWEALGQVVADLCTRYKIPVTPKTVLTHAEVQGTLGITQAGKWDIARLPWAPEVRGARACGDVLRAEVQDAS